jgi:two-component system, NtrC family, response regulator AtoC
MENRNSGATILVADDDFDARNYFETLLKLQGYEVVLAASGEEALHYLAAQQCPASLVLLDVMMPGKDGVETFQEIRVQYRDLPVVLVSSAPSWPYIMEAINNDSLDGTPAQFLEKPVVPEELLTTIEDLLQLNTMTPAPVLAPAIVSPSVPSRQPTVRNARMMEIEGLLQQVGLSDVPVLLQGETGVGKEVLARQLHAHSTRAQNRFLKLNCAALPPDLVESELFGYERGAFTGAFRDRPGKFEMARGGTILLDEIGDMDFRLQAKLLQVLQDSEFQRLGSSETIHVDVRVMAATHRDLKKAIRDGSFREDLYYRLNVINIHVPPIRERKEEIAWLADYFIRKHATSQMPPLVIPSALHEAMMAYNWPGNVREIENMMRKLLVLRQPKFILDELRSLASTQDEFETRTPPRSDNASKMSVLQRVEQSKRNEETEAILAALATAHWNRKHAATLLNLDYKAFLYKMKKLDIESKPTALPYESSNSRCAVRKAVPIDSERRVARAEV